MGSDQLGESICEFDFVVEGCDGPAFGGSLPVGEKDG